MKGHLAIMLAAAGTLASVGPVTAHPGHSPTDLTAQLAAPLAGPDHIAVLATLSVLAALVAARVVLHLVARQTARASRHRR